MKHRKLRIAWSVAWGLLVLLLVVLWVRSYSYRDGFWGRISDPIGFRVSSSAGSIHVAELRHLGIVAWQPTIREALPDASRPQPIFGKFQFSQNGLGSYTSVPYWFILLTVTLFGAAPWVAACRFRFSLRTLLIATTLVAVAFGLMVWAIR
jgi:hypothetical protein